MRRRESKEEEPPGALARGAGSGRIDTMALEGLVLARQGLDVLVQPVPVAGQLLDDVHHARRQDIGGRGQDARQLGAQEALPLPHGNAALQQEGAVVATSKGLITTDYAGLGIAGLA